MSTAALRHLHGLFIHAQDLNTSLSPSGSSILSIEDLLYDVGNTLLCECACVCRKSNFLGAFSSSLVVCVCCEPFGHPGF